MTLRLVFLLSALAAACGAANAMTPDSGWVRPSDLGEILPKVVVEDVT